MASCSEEVMDVQWVQTVVRKLRKKLRQIERLERLERELTEEELDKICTKDNIRTELSQNLAILGEATSANVNKSPMMLAITDSQSDVSTQNDSSYNLEASAELSQKLAIPEEATPANVSNSSELLAIMDSQPDVSAQNDSSYSLEKPTNVDTAQKDLSVQPQNVNGSYDSELNISDFPQVLHSPDNLEHNSEGPIVKLPSSYMCSTPKSVKKTVTVEDVDAAIPDTTPDKILSGSDIPTSTVSPGSGSTQKAVKKREKGGEGGGGGKKVAAAATAVSKDARSVWRERGFLVTTLEGHFDVICSLDTNGVILMSGSRDTTVKVWCLHSLMELHSMGGHKAAVTCVKILPRDEEIEGLEDSLDTDQNSFPSQLGISGSLDCQINIWDLDTGQKLGHIYTFSSITCLEYFRKKAITGSDGGKVEIWDLQTRQSLCVLRGPSKGVTSMCLGGHRLYIGDTGGTIEVWNVASLEQQDELVVPEKPDLRWNPAEVDVATASGGMRVPFYPRCVRCIAAHEGRVFWGDDGTNVKVLHCETGVAHRLTNHTHRFGSTGGLAVYPHEKLLLAAGYDLDKGNANINVRSIPSETYLCSISIPDCPTPYISCIVTTTTAADGRGRGEKLRVCTGGNELKVWDVTSVGKLPDTEGLQPHQSIAHCSHDSCYDASFYTDTESEGEGSSDEDSLSPSTLHTHPLPHTTPKGKNIDAVQRRESWLWWLWKCNIL